MNLSFPKFLEVIIISHGHDGTIRSLDNLFFQKWCVGLCCILFCIVFFKDTFMGNRRSIGAIIVSKLFEVDTQYFTYWSRRCLRIYLLCTPNYPIYWWQNSLRCTLLMAFITWVWVNLPILHVFHATFWLRVFVAEFLSLCWWVIWWNNGYS